MYVCFLSLFVCILDEQASKQAQKTEAGVKLNFSVVFILNKIKIAKCWSRVNMYISLEIGNVCVCMYFEEQQQQQ